MWCVTCDQEKYSSPEEAYDSIRTREKVGKLIRKMGWRYAITVLEWHKSGWPHWHILVWEPTRRMYYCKHEVQRTWGEGNTWYTGSNGRSGERAINYLCKYMTKAQEYPTPDWALDRHNVRTLSSTRAWGPINAKAQRRSEDLEAPSSSTESERSPIRSNREAIAECGSQTVIMKEYIDGNGELRVEFVERLNIEYRYMRRMLTRLKGFKDRIKSCMGHIRVPEGTIEAQKLHMAMVSYKI